MQRVVVLVGDQDLRNVALRVGPDGHGAVRERGRELGKGWHVLAGPYPVWAVEGIDYTVRRSDRARRVRVTVDAARGVEVVLPQSVFRRGAGAAEREAAAAIRELRPWIERRLRDQAGTRAAIAARGDAVPYLGETLLLVPEPGRTRVHRRGAELLVPAGAGPHAGARALVPAGSARGDRAAARRGLRAGRPHLLAADDPRPAHTLGKLLARPAR